MGNFCNGPDVVNLFRKAVDFTKKEGASDIHLISGHPLWIRLHGEIMPFGEGRISEEGVWATVEEFLDREVLEKVKAHYRERGDADFAIAVDGLNFRCNLYKHMDGVALAARPIPSRLWSIEEIGLPPRVLDFLDKRQGLIVVAGPTGHGKTTTLACMLDHINRNKSCRIITIEDPIEYRFQPIKAAVTQREVGTHTKDFATALRAALRQDPDVIMVGEMRDMETMNTVLNAAETGHLVLTTLHTRSAKETVERIVNIFPSERQNLVRYILSSVLLMVICQRLIPRAHGNGRVLAYEIMVNLPQIAALIRQDKLHQIPNHILMLREEEEAMTPLNECLRVLVMRGIIRREDAYAVSYDPEGLQI